VTRKTSTPVTLFRFLVVAAALAVAWPCPSAQAAGLGEAGRRAIAAGEPLPRIVCPPGYTASIYASGLISPDGLAFAPDGRLAVAEERAGRVSRIELGGARTLLTKGLASPEGIAFDSAGNLYVVEDVQDGRLLRVDPAGKQTVLASGLDAPEGIAWSPDGQLYATESNVQFAANPPWDFVTGITRVSPDGALTTILTDTLAWSYSAPALSADGFLYVANEASNVGTTDSIFRVDLASGQRTLFASELTAPEGLAFSPGGFFPLYVAEENLGDGHGRLSLVQADGQWLPLCTGFGTIEDVAVDKGGNVYVTEDVNGLIVQILVTDRIPPQPPMNLVASPPGWTATNVFSLTWQNPTDPSGIAGAYLKLDTPPSAAADGTLYPGAALTQVLSLTVAAPGAHPAYLWLEDGAGNAAPANAAVALLQYDPDPPGPPLDLAVEPAEWAPTDAFTLTWTNPPELAGVMAACYQLERPGGGAASAATCPLELGLDRLTGVTVNGDGAHPLSLWLVDAAGNADPGTAVSVTLRHDALAPLSVAAAPTATRTAPIRVTWTATDAHSGVERVSLWVRAGDAASWADTGLSSAGDGPGFFLYYPAGEGLYRFATVAVDRAGNSEGAPAGEGDARTLCQTWQWVYLPLAWKEEP